MLLDLFRGLTVVSLTVGSCTGGNRTLWICSGWTLSDDFMPATTDLRIAWRLNHTYSWDITSMGMPIKHWDVYGEPWP